MARTTLSWEWTIKCFAASNTDLSIIAHRLDNEIAHAFPLGKRRTSAWC